LANWTTEQFELLDNALKDTKHYGSPEEVKKALGLSNEEFDAIENLLITHYTNISTNYKN
jgi:hypothetical protein